MEPVVHGSDSSIVSETTLANGSPVIAAAAKGSPVIDHVKEAAAAAKAKAELTEGIVIPRTELLKTRSSFSVFFFSILLTDDCNTETGIIAFQILSGYVLSRESTAGADSNH